MGQDLYFYGWVGGEMLKSWKGSKKCWKVEKVVASASKVAGWGLR